MRVDKKHAIAERMHCYTWNLSWVLERNYALNLPDQEFDEEEMFFTWPSDFVAGFIWMWLTSKS